MPDVNKLIDDELNVAEAKAIDALSRYKFQMFGYWAAIWVHLNAYPASVDQTLFVSMLMLLGAAEIRRSPSKGVDYEQSS
jgi:hypothetical protein